MNAYFKMTSQKIADRLGLVPAQVIADDVNGSFWSLTAIRSSKKATNSARVWAGTGVTDDLAAP
jgi:hypothetical protein